MSTTSTDDLDAVRTIVDTIKDFTTEDKQRILRWVAEKFNFPQTAATPTHASTQPFQNASEAHPTASRHPLPPATGTAVDIKTFIAGKKPRNDVQFAAAVAYYYRFESPQAERKEAINKEDLQDAARKAGRERFANPLQTLSNAHTLGLLDKGPEKATFSLNSVGENLVAMTLPDGTPVAKSVKKKRVAKPATKKTAAKKAPSKAAKRA